MTQVKNFPSIDSVKDEDCLLTLNYSGYNTQKITIANFKKWLLANVLGVQNDVTVYRDLPIAGFSQSFPNETSNFHMIITPNGTLATGTVIFPQNPVDKQTVSLTSTSIITALTLNGNGKTIMNPITMITAGGFVKYKYDAINSKWYKYGN